MSQPIIQVSNLSKCYRLGQIGMTSLKDDIERMWTGFRARMNKAGGQEDAKETSRQGTRDFWALRDVSFKVQQGEVLGIIGRNGAGKSTLLKLLSRITEPTRGHAVIRGRTASLLEVGTGFHPDLTGRENIFLNGAILGMSRKETAAKFDDIVAFAEIAQFIDTPVKRYSSGMFVRLAFAVAAHLEPEIMIVDEVLAVGDIAFQRKCLGKMGDFSRQSGRTILFVSHNMHAIERLCQRCLVLDKGGVLIDTRDLREAIEKYHEATSQDTVGHSWIRRDDTYDNDWLIPERLYLTCGEQEFDGRPLHSDDDVQVVIEGECRDPDESLQIGYGLLDADNEVLFWSTNTDASRDAWARPSKGRFRLQAPIPLRMLNEGEYRVDLFLGLFHRKWISEPGKSSVSLKFEIRGGLSDSPFWPTRRPGILAPMINWECDSL